MPGVSHWRVDPAEAGQKLVRFVDRRFQRAVPLSALQRWIRTGQVRVDGARVRPDTRLGSGQTVRIPPHEPGPQAILRPAAADLTVLHETEDLLILVKPAGLPVHPGSGHADSIAARIRARSKASPWTPTPAHRLDRDTSGLLAVAKSYHRLRQLHESWRSGQVRKAYLAWLSGLAEWDEPALITAQAAKARVHDRERMVLGQGKTLASLVWTIARQDRASLALIAPLTGRTHQVRVQLAGLGHPLLGDRKYGGPARQDSGAQGRGMLLHAWYLAWPGFEQTLLPQWPVPWSTTGLIDEETLLERTRALFYDEQGLLPKMHSHLQS